MTGRSPVTCGKLGQCGNQLDDFEARDSRECDPSVYNKKIRVSVENRIKSNQIKTLLVKLFYFFYMKCSSAHISTYLFLGQQGTIQYKQHWAQCNDIIN